MNGFRIPESSWVRDDWLASGSCLNLESSCSLLTLTGVYLSILGVQFRALGTLDTFEQSQAIAVFPGCVTTVLLTLSCHRWPTPAIDGSWAVVVQLFWHDCSTILHLKQKNIYFWLGMGYCTCYFNQVKKLAQWRKCRQPLIFSCQTPLT